MSAHLGDNLTDSSVRHRAVERAAQIDGSNPIFRQLPEVITGAACLTPS